MTLILPNPIPLPRVREAAERLAGLAVRTPLARLETETKHTLHLKLECLQPIGSFKIRGAGNAISQASDAEIAAGVWTASAGNMAQGVAWCARARGVRCTVVVPDHAPAAKTDAILRLGGTLVRRPFDEWWQILVDRGAPGMQGFFVHPVSDEAVIAGNGTIGLEILADLPDVDAIVVPFGGGGLSCGIASAAKALKPGVKVFAAEVETATPFARALVEGHPTGVGYTASFVDGIGSRSVLSEMWPLASTLLDGSIIVSLEEVASALRLTIDRAHVVAEGAGAAAVAAGLRLAPNFRSVACVVSGGNIDRSRLATILAGNLPQ
jgi:threonine dehydratase